MLENKNFNFENTSVPRDFKPRAMLVNPSKCNSKS